jgi:STIP1 family protein 1
MAHLAEKLKQQGNDLFKAGDYAAAEEQYTAAITKYSRNPLLFTNRALARIRLQRWQGVIDDCLHSITLTPHNAFNFKSYFYLAQAQLALHHPNEALSSALTAYNQAMHPPPAEAIKATSALPSLSEFVLKCKKEKFAARERQRRRQRGDILEESL